MRRIDGCACSKSLGKFLRNSSGAIFGFLQAPGPAPQRQLDAFLLQVDDLKLVEFVG